MQKQFRIPFFCLVTIICNYASALIAQPADTAYINRLNEQSFKLLKKFPDSAVALADKAIAFSKEINYLNGLGDGYIRLGLVEKDKGNYEEALVNYRNSLQYRKQIGNEDLTARVYNNMGMAFTWQAQYDSAIFYIIKSLQIAEKLNLKTYQATYLMNLGIAYENNKDYNKAIACNEQAMQLYSEEEDSTGIMKTYISRGTLYNSLQDYNKSLQFSRTALALARLLDDERNEFIAIGNMALAYQEINKYDSALYYYLQSLQYKTEVRDERGTAIDMSNMGMLYQSIDKPDSAIYFLTQSLSIAEKIGEINLASKDAGELAGIYSEKNDFKKAFDYECKFSQYSDSVFNQSKAQAIAGIQTKYETEKKEKEIQLLNKNNEIKTLELRKQEVVRNSLIGGAALIILIGFLLFNRYRVSQQHKQQAERMRISSDLHDEVGSTLSSISMISSYAATHLSENKQAEAEKLLTEVAASAIQMGDDMNDIIWAINPNNDNFESSINRLRSYASRMTQSKNISLHFDSDERLHTISLSMDERKNLYLICKEVINNAVKYSGCKNLSISFEKNKNQLDVCVSDDGCGFDINNCHEGNGLKNMEKRAKDLNATLTVSSQPNTGVKIILVKGIV